MIIGLRFFPFFVNEYSTVGGIVANAFLFIIFFVSSCLSSLTNIRVLIPVTFLSSSLNRIFPFIKVLIMDIVHFPEIKSIASWNGQSWLLFSSFVVFEIAILPITLLYVPIYQNGNYLQI